MKERPYATEADLVADFVAQLTSDRPGGRGCDWTVYAETAGWDLLLVHRDGFQVGVEAKLTLNAKVIDQALSGAFARYDHARGPDYRGVLVPASGLQHHLVKICKAIGIGIITVRPAEKGIWRYFDLPSEESYGNHWPNWCPAERCVLPDYVPDVEAGHSSPVQLTDWKVRAIKLMILLDRAGSVSRADMKALGISPTRWTDLYHGFLQSSPRGYVQCDRTPDLRAQHPRNYAEIEADFDSWNPYSAEAA